MEIYFLMFIASILKDIRSLYNEFGTSDPTR